MEMRRSCFVFAIAGWFLAEAATPKATWDYKGAAGWGGEHPACGVGLSFESQSPVDLPPGNSREGDATGRWLASAVDDTAAVGRGAAVGGLKTNYSAVTGVLAYDRRELRFPVASSVSAATQWIDTADLALLVRGWGLSPPAAFAGGAALTTTNSYKLFELRFHWGASDAEGSEHTVGGMPFPLEVQLVHYRLVHGSPERARRAPLGLAIVTLLFKLGPEAPALAPLVGTLPRLVAGGRDNRIESPVALDLPALLAPVLDAEDHLSAFSAYGGSETTPPCEETVLWIAPHTRPMVSRTQLAAFRALDPSGLTSRPIQPLNGRQIIQVPFSGNDLEQGEFTPRRALLQQPPPPPVECEAPPPPPPPSSNAIIGTSTDDADDSVDLHLRAAGPGGSTEDRIVVSSAGVAVSGALSVDGDQVVTLAVLEARLASFSSGPPRCMEPKGRLTFNDTWLCVCEHGWSGQHCEVSPSLSRIEPASAMRIVGVSAVGDSGHVSGYGPSRTVDGDITTTWKANSGENEYVVFDLQASKQLLGVSVRAPGGNSTTTPAECRLEFSTDSATGPWLIALTFQPEVLHRWQYFPITTVTPTRYVRIFVETNHSSATTVEIQEVEFFTTNAGTRSTVSNEEVGTIRIGGSEDVPLGWLECDGRAVLRSSYPVLFATIGSTWGAGDGSTTFNLPNLKSRMPAGRDADSSDASFHATGASGGAASLTLTPQDLPSHSHSVTIPSHSHNAYIYSEFIYSESGPGSEACVYSGIDRWATCNRGYRSPMSSAGGGTYTTAASGDGASSIDIRNPRVIVTFMIKALP